MYNFKQTQKIQADLKKVFEFFQKPENLAKVTPQWISFSIKSKPPLQMKECAEFEYTIKLYGIPLLWRTKIVRYSPPDIFVDEQLKRPYKTWIHTHKFQQSDGYVIMEDNIDYDLYGGIFKDLVHKLFVNNSIKEIFKFRKEVIEKELNSLI